MITIHGQHEHQSLLQSSSHLDFLDGFGKLFELRQKVSRHYQHYQELAELRRKQEQDLNQRSMRMAELKEMIEELQELALNLVKKSICLRKPKAFWSGKTDPIAFRLEKQAERR